MGHKCKSTQYCLILLFGTARIENFGAIEVRGTADKALWQGPAILTAHNAAAWPDYVGWASSGNENITSRR